MTSCVRTLPVTCIREQHVRLSTDPLFCQDEFAKPSSGETACKDDTPANAAQGGQAASIAPIVAAVATGTPESAATRDLQQVRSVLPTDIQSSPSVIILII